MITWSSAVQSQLDPGAQNQSYKLKWMQWNDVYEVYIIISSLYAQLNGDGFYVNNQ